ncbi:MAG: alkaline phosphatase [Arenimonas sp.]|uniref:alkaline phosphatase n=1 Tax=Arenimonas sp. TaxID=1872635 RepID=UPI0025C0F95A|nr:alkaline phosphatase [Arenimonas sp.]MBW8367804.1 alkaline phosphatase [Arenimonas sp.]
MKSTLFLAFAATLATSACTPAQTRPAAPRFDASPVVVAPDTSVGWFGRGAEAAAQRDDGRAQARNLVLFVGDGMSLTTVAAARILEGQRRGQPGEENLLAFERFEHTAFAKTYNTDSQTPDSAGTMTAMATGVKNRIGVLGLGPEVRRGDCAAAPGHGLVSMIELAESAGLATGIVTSTRLTHATPAALYARSPDRNWESDVDLPAEAVAQGCRDIARQFVEFEVGDGIEVALGGGRREFLPASGVDPEYPEFPGRRLDGRDLMAEWTARHPDGRLVWNAAQLQALDLANTPRLLGLFEPDHMKFEHDRPRDRAGEPSLAELTGAALKVLKRHRQGFVLVVEGGRIDHAHHEGNAHRALTDTVAMAEAVALVMAQTDPRDTLVIVTADHSHTLSFAGYPVRGNPILGKVVGLSSEDSQPGLARDATGLPYTTLMYANGPGYHGASAQQPAGPKRHEHKASGYEMATTRPDLANVDTTHPDYLQASAYPLASESHGGDDVGLWASGPGAQGVRGTMEQNVLFHLMVQAQPALRAELCRLSPCRSGRATGLPLRDRLRVAAPR